MFTSRLTILTCKRVLSLSTLYIKVCYFYSKPKEKKKKTQESVERVMDGNSMRLVIVMIMMMGFVMLALGVSLFFSKPLIKSKVFTLTKLIPR